MRSETPRSLGRYEVIAALAVGGMAEILLARALGPGGFCHPVVLKRILPHLAKELEYRDMFMDEAAILAAVRHPNVVTVHEFDREGEDLFLALEYLEGESVGSILRRAWSRGFQLGPRLAAHVVAECCAGLHAAHELTDERGAPRQLVHRDVSPQNVFVTYDGAVKLLDFGIAMAMKRHTKTEAGVIKGKFAYMSPEQALGRPLDRRSDIFAAGILLYELATQRRLFMRDSELATLKAITEEPIVPPREIAPECPAELEAICLRALARHARDRYATTAEMRRELTAFVHRSPGELLPEQELAASMRELFDERAREKTQMRELLYAGSSVASVPAAESDVTIELPRVEPSRAIAPIVSAPDDGDASRSKTSGSRRRVAAIALPSAALLLAAGAVAALRPPSRPEAPAPPPAAPVASGVSSAPSAPPEVSPLPAEVALRMESVPPGASVWVDGREVAARTPAEVRLPASFDPVEVEIRREGFDTFKQTIVPTVARTLSVTLTPRERPKVHTRSRASATPGTSKPAYEKL
ncbi:MAG: serine/threonine protein kinase [Labilithrix sp.]|nr:serine/threonine protein kinase [Labilithrix sp.]